MIYLAYDGSLNAAWVFRYALRLASHAPDKALALIHVEDGSLAPGELEHKSETLRKECVAHGVTLFIRSCPFTESVRHCLVQAIPAGTDNLTLCGTRIRSPRKPLLTGTVTEQLLRDAPFPVLALRVVQPGLLGVPRDLLLPLAGHPRGFGAAWPFFRLFLPDLDTVHLLRGVLVRPARLSRLSRLQFLELREEGVRYLAEVADEIHHHCPSAPFRLDSRIVVCANWVREILVHASRLHSRLILLGASQRPRLHSFLHGRPLERLLRDTPCDMGIYRWP